MRLLTSARLRGRRASAYYYLGTVIITVSVIILATLENRKRLHPFADDAEIDAISDNVTYLYDKDITGSCKLILSGDYKTTQLAKHSRLRLTKPSESYLAASCAEIINKGYIVDERLVPKEELSFPLALQFLVYKDVWQFERLLRAVYRPHNFYCVHVDARSSPAVALAVNKLASCFANVFTPLQRVAVDYGKISQVDAELACMRRLYKSSAKWKYLINLTGQEFPLKTMWQLVRILKALNGSNAVEGSVSGMNMNSDRRDQLLPFARKYNITPVKGATHIVVVRGFVQFVFENPIAVEMHKWLKDAPNPDETLFPTLNHNPSLNVPGAYLGLAEVDSVRNPFINRLKNWGSWPCHGFYRHSVCVWGVGDLPYITNNSRKEMFVNKLEWNSQHYALDCLEQWYWKKTVLELQRYYSGEQVEFDVSYYAKLDLAFNHL